METPFDQNKFLPITKWKPTYYVTQNKSDQTTQN